MDNFEKIYKPETLVQMGKSKERNPYHEPPGSPKGGQFTTGPKTSSDKKREKYKEVKHLSDFPNDRDRRVALDSFVSVPLFNNYFKDRILKLLSLAGVQEIEEPSDELEILDKNGIDYIFWQSNPGDLSKAYERDVDLKTVTSLFGKPENFDNPSFSFQMKMTNKKGDIIDGWNSRKNLTDFLCFMAIKTRKDDEELFQRGRKTKMATDADFEEAKIIFVDKTRFKKDYLVKNFFNNEEEMKNEIDIMQNNLLKGSSKQEKVFTGKNGKNIKLIGSNKNGNVSINFLIDEDNILSTESKRIGSFKLSYISKNYEKKMEQLKELYDKVNPMNAKSGMKASDMPSYEMSFLPYVDKIGVENAIKEMEETININKSFFKV